MNRNIGDYTLVAKIADGGMGEVFKAVKRGIFGFEKPVVLKTLLPFYSDQEDFIKMLSSEAKASSLLDHPNIVQTIDFLSLDQNYYLVMEYVNGVDLGRLMSKARKENTFVDPYTGLYIISEALKGLKHAHDLLHEGNPVKIIHRDISPQNILISYDGVVKIADFGIAISPFSEARTKSGELKGKARYMSPEQIKKETLDERSDIFSLSIIFFELIYGKNPFDRGNEFETLKNIAESVEPVEFPQSKSLNPKIARILVKALSRDKELRYKKADLMLKELMNTAPKKVFKTGQERLKCLMRSLFPEKEMQRPIEATPILRSAGSPSVGVSLLSNKKGTIVWKKPAVIMLASLIVLIFIFGLQKIVLLKTTTTADNKEGMVSINSYPWSTVYINGKETGETPIKEMRLKEGDYILNMVFKDGRRILKEIQVKNGKHIEVFEKLPKK